MSNRFYSILVINWQDVKNPQSGGAEVHLHEIFKRLADRGHKVTLLCCRYRGCPTVENVDGIHTIRVGHRNLFNFVVKRQYRKLRQEYHFDIVIDDINKIPFFTPRFVQEPLLAIVHHFFGKSIFLETGWLGAQYVYQTEKMVPAAYKNIPFAAVSNSTQQELLSKGINSHFLMPNAIEIEKYPLNRKTNEKLVIGYLGRMKKYKSADHVLAAMPHILAKVPNVELYMMGSGDFLTALEEMAEKLGIQDNVHFTGYVSHFKKVELLNQIDVVINPSPKEGWGQTVLEANACGAPVVAADSPGLRDSVIPDSTGLLYPFGDIEQLAAKTIDLLSDAEKRQSLSQAARLWAESWSWEDSADKTEEMIQLVLTQGSVDS